jgi:DNA helicase HerA-like ATPase
MSHGPALNLGSWQGLDGGGGGDQLLLPARHLVTHGVAVGMTGSGKSGLVTVLVEEALSAGVPTIVIDVKGDLPNLLLTFPEGVPETLRPWVGPLTSEASAEQRAFATKTALRVITPGATSGESLHVLSALERRSSRWDTDEESARDALSAAVSLVLRLLGRDPDPAKSREHVLLSVLAERRLMMGENADIATLMKDLVTPPISEIGALSLNSFLRKSERSSLAAALNSLLASPTFASWRKGVSLDVAEWLTPRDGRTPGVIVSVAHLDDEERALVLGVVLEEILSWVRGLPGSSELKALIVFDEVYGYLPPHPANPPTKRPIVSLMKQARAFGVGVVIATQNPMDLDYRALSNAGLWWIGRLQTDADRARVMDGLSGATNNTDDLTELERIVPRLAPRWFVVKNAHASAAGPLLLKPRDTWSLMRGPLTRNELRQVREWRAGARQVKEA